MEFMALWHCDPGHRENNQEDIAMLSSKYIHPGATRNLLYDLSIDIDARTNSSQ
jgi:hypothetical protein